MKPRARFWRRAGILALAALLSSCGSTPPAPTPGLPQGNGETAVPPPADDWRTRVAALGERIEAKRKELGIPGLSLVVVKGDEVVYLAGHGLADVEAKRPVTEDTHFAIGSTTKAFTALLALMAEAEGKLALDDSPKKCLPYFSLKDPEADQAITIEHLMTHESGLMRTDLGWITGELDKKEVIELAGKAEPVAKVGEEFHYQNVMYLAAGECVASAMGTSYEALLRERIFAPLGMDSANVSVAKMLTLPTRAVGYREVGEARKLEPVQMRPLDSVAPAGAINASARDMGQWLKLLVADGVVDGKPLVPAAVFARMFEPRIAMGPSAQYGLGWIIGEWNGKKEISHTGGIDGFVTLVSMLPEEDVAFGLFTNIQNADIHGYVTNEVYGALTGIGLTQAADEGAKAEAGSYGAVGGMKMEVKWEDGTLRLHVPNQPAYPLEKIDGRRYRLGAPAPAGFFVTFRAPAKGPAKTEMVLEQPHGTIVVPELTPEVIAAVQAQKPTDAMRALRGAYKLTDAPVELRIAESEGRIALMIPGQHPGPLVDIGQADRFGLDAFPAEFTVEVLRDDDEITGFKLHTPQQVIEATRVGGSDAPKITVAELKKKIAAAHGARALGKLRTMTVTTKMDFVNQGLTADSVVHRRAEPRGFAEHATLKAFDRAIGKIATVWDDGKALQYISFAPGDPLEGAEATALELQAVMDPYSMLDQLFDEIAVERVSKVEDEDVYVVRLTHASGIEVTEYYSTRTFLLRKRTTVIPRGPDSSPSTSTAVYGDYKKVRGVMIPHRVTTEGPHGKIVQTVTKVAMNPKLPADAFQAQGAAPSP